jgi:hypothetical protein
MPKPSPTKPVSSFPTWLPQWFASFPLSFRLLPQITETQLSFLPFSSVFAKFTRTPFEIFHFIFVRVIVCAGTS